MVTATGLPLPTWGPMRSLAINHVFISTANMSRSALSRGDTGPAEETVRVRNCGGGLLRWTAAEDCDWLEVTPVAGVASAHFSDITLTALPQSIPTGLYTCTVHIADPAATNDDQQIFVTFRVNRTLSVPFEYPTIQDAIDQALCPRRRCRSGARSLHR